MTAISNVLINNGFQNIQLDLNKRRGKELKAYHLKDNYLIDIDKFKKEIQAAINQDRKKKTFSIENLSQDSFRKRPYFIQYGNILSFGKDKPFKAGVRVNIIDQYFSGNLLENPVKCIHNKKFEKDRFVEWLKDKANGCPCGKPYSGNQKRPSWAQLTLRENQSIKNQKHLLESSGPSNKEIEEELNKSIESLKQSQVKLSNAINNFDEIFFSQVDLSQIISIEYKQALDKYVAVGSSLALAAGGTFLLVTVPGGVIGGILLSGGLSSGARLCNPIFQGKKINLKGHFTQIGIGFAVSTVSLPIDIYGAKFIKDALWNEGTKSAASYCLWATGGAISGFTSKTLQNLVNKNKWYNDCMVATFSGSIAGIASGAFAHHFKPKGLGDKATYKQVFDNKEAVKKVALTSLVGGAAGTISAGVSTVAVNWFVGNQWNENLSKNAFEAGLVGLIRGAINGSVEIYHERQYALEIKKALIKHLENAEETMPELGKNLACATNGEEQKKALIELIKKDAISVFGETTLEELLKNPHGLFKGLLDEKLIYDKTGHRIAEVLNTLAITGGLTLIIFGGPGGQVLGGALLSAGITGLQDAVTKDINNYPLDLNDHLTKIAVSGSIGLVTSGISTGAVSLMRQGVQSGIQVITLQIGKHAATGAFAGLAGKATGNIAENILQQKPVYNDLGRGMKKAALAGAVGGAVGAGIGMGFQKLAKQLDPTKKVMFSAIGGGLGGGVAQIAMEGIETGEFNAQGFTIAVVTGAVIGGGVAYKEEVMLRRRAIFKEFAKPGNRKRAIVALAQEDKYRLEFIDAKTKKTEVWNPECKEVIRIELSEPSKKGSTGHATAILKNGQRVDFQIDDTYCLERAYLIGKKGFSHNPSDMQLRNTRTKSQDLLAPKLGNIFSKEYTKFKEEGLFCGKRSRAHAISEDKVNCPLRKKIIRCINDVIKQNKEQNLLKGKRSLSERDIQFLNQGKSALCMRGGTKFQSKAFVDLGVNPLRHILETYDNNMCMYAKREIKHVVDQAPKVSAPIYPTQKNINARFSSKFDEKRITDVARNMISENERPIVGAYPESGGYFKAANNRALSAYELSGKDLTKVSYEHINPNKQHFPNIPNYDKNILPTKQSHIEDHQNLRFVFGTKQNPKQNKSSQYVSHKPVDKRK
ncbi:MAG: hypothetical protein AAF443_04780 [Chlamydiota bacterium]